ncbi:MgtC/SapB family protein [Undibacterium sp. TS12]|uniref:MgtC/SapB family protein n=1 Tax=Undibacterium sp. TS12 TaxID=2908202 RepID=UPI001F4CAA13|nr:MgtC/SapB family protein [Undibacterium sp. TS12]MCH8617800.1 MgtC/SapB family protein [Undibacterium sp. TS12]
MMQSFYSYFMTFWSPAELHANLIIFMNLAGAMLLGFVVGYERSYHGRAAGMRTYGLVCMASAALVVIAGYPDFWFGARALMPVNLDPSRTIQGVVTGIGFLGAGVIMREGFTISGLTTAASLWASSAIGVLVGVGFYAAAILLAFLSAACMIWVSRLESWLPSRPAIAITMQFRQGYIPREESLRQMALERGYEIAAGTLNINCKDGRAEWRFVAVAVNRKQAMRLSELSLELGAFDGVEFYNLAHARN